VSLQACTAGIVTDVREAELPPAPRAVTRLAIMPLTTEPGSEYLRPDLGPAVTRVLDRRFPNIVIFSPGESRDRLASAGATEYAALLEDYDRTGVVERKRIADLTDALGVDHFLQLRATYLEEEFLDTELFDDEELTTEDREVLAVVVRLWAADGGAPVWEAVVRTRSETGSLDFRTAGRDALIVELAEVLGERLPIAR